MRSKNEQPGFRPPSTEDFYNRGVTKNIKGDRQGAIAEFNEAIRLKPDYALAFHNRGLAKYNLGDYQGAIADYNEAIRLKPDDARVFYNRGDAKDELGDTQGAIVDYNEAIRLKPDYTEAFYNRGFAKHELSDYQGAITDFNAAICLDPGDAEAFHYCGYAKDNLGDYQGAIADYNEAIRLKPNDARIFYNRGVAKDNLDDYQGAIADFNAAIGLKPHYVAFSYRGLAKEKLGNYQEAIVDYNEAIRLNPDDAMSFNYRGGAKLELGDYQGAITDYDKAIRLTPDDEEAFNNRGLAKRKLGDYKGAITDYNEAIRLNPDFAAALNNRGVAKENLGDYQEAIADYDKAICLKPDDAEVFYCRGLAKDKLGDYQRAIEDYNEAARLNPGYADAFYCLGIIKGRLNDYQGAILDYNEAIRLKPDDANAFYGRGNAKYSLGDYQEALVDYEQALTLKKGDYPKAATFLKEARARLQAKNSQPAQRKASFPTKTLPPMPYEKSIESVSVSTPLLAYLFAQLRSNQIKTLCLHQVNKGGDMAGVLLSDEEIGMILQTLTANQSITNLDASKIKLAKVPKGISLLKQILSHHPGLVKVNLSQTKLKRKALKALLPGLDKAAQLQQLTLSQDKSNLVLHLAASEGYKSVVSLLLRSKAQVNSQDKQGNRALHKAAKKGHKGIVGYLLEQGADAELVNKAGLTAAQVASIAGKTSLADLLPNLAINPSMTTVQLSSTHGQSENQLQDSQVNTLASTKEIAYQQLSLNQSLGRGSYGEVFDGEYQFNPVAIKKLFEQGHELQTSFQQEVALLMQLRSPYLIQTYGACFSPGQYCLVMEYAPKGSLAKLLREPSLFNEADQKAIGQWPIRYQMAIDISRGLAYLHSQNMIHGDLKSDNILVDNHYHAKIGDFGCLKLKSTTMTRTLVGRSWAGSTRWMAPEVMDDNPTSKESDAYSYGMVLWELGARKVPYEGRNDSQVRRFVFDKDGREEITTDTPPPMARLIARCWEKRAKERPQAAEAITLLNKEQEQLYNRKL